MRIDGWQIEGFGIFQDWEVRGLPAGLTVFLGPNEAGKSTLLAFLRGALFGFPGKRRRSRQFPPLRGGRHGGRLILCGPEGDVTIERLVGKKNGLRVNGSESDGEELRALLGGADEKVFCSVFAFSLSEMQSFEWLKTEHIRERIFSAGIAGAGASARQVIQTLDEECSAVFRPRGSSRVKDLLARIQDAQQRWRLAQLEAERYLSLQEDEQKWRARAMELAAEEQDLRQRQRSVEDSLDLWSDLDRAREQLAALDPIDEFPGDPEARLAALNAHAQDARAVAQKLQAEQAAKERSRAQLAAGFDDRLASISERVEEFHTRLPSHRERLEAFRAAGARHGDRAGRIQLSAAGVSACVALIGGWLMARGGTAEGLAVLVAGSITAAFLLYLRRARRQQWAGETARLEQEIAGWEQPVREWSGSSGSGEQLISGFLALRERCSQDRNGRAKLAALTEAIAESAAQLESARRDLESAEEALLTFLRHAGAADEVEFLSRLQTFRSRQRLRARIQDREARIAAIEPRLSLASIDEWKRESSRLLEMLAELQARRDEAVGEQRVAEAAHRQIAESTAVTVIKAELECLSSELAAAVRQWRVANLATELVRRTLHEFTRTRQPAVLEEASSAFARITAGAYERILQEEDGESLVALDREGRRKRPEELSRGTAEQLYLCLRLGLAAEFARRTVSLPLIMDDVLVNFDPHRAGAVARELIRLSRQRQVLVFTCHPETARLFSEAAPETNIVPMGPRRESFAAK